MTDKKKHTRGRESGENKKHEKTKGATKTGEESMIIM